MRNREAWDCRRLLEASSKVQNFCRVKLTKKAIINAMTDENRYHKPRICVKRKRTPRLTVVAAPPEMTKRMSRAKRGWFVLTRANAFCMEGKRFAIKKNRTREV